MSVVLHLSTSCHYFYRVIATSLAHKDSCSAETSEGCDRVLLIYNHRKKKHTQLQPDRSPWRFMGSQATIVVNISNLGSHPFFVYYNMTILVEIIPFLEQMGIPLQQYLLAIPHNTATSPGPDNPKANTGDRIVMLWALGSSMGMS